MAVRSVIEKLCKVSGCGRRPRAKGYCQTHRKHLLKLGQTRPIRPQRARRQHSVRMSGLCLTLSTVYLIEREAKRRNVARNAVITDILEEWSRTDL